MAQAPESNRTSVFRNRNFTLLWFGLVISNSGAWMQMVAQGWLVYELTDSPFYLGLVGTARAFAMIILPPFGGVLADRVARLRLLKITRFVSLGFALLMAVLVATDLVQVWHIFVLSLLSGMVEAFDQPARTALLPNLVRKEDLSRAIGLNSAAWQGSALFGPTLAGVLIATVGIEAAFFAHAASYVSVLAALYLMRDVPERADEHLIKRGIGEDLFAGLRYVRSSRMILLLLGLAVVTSVFGRSYQQLLPVFSRDVLDSGSSGLGIMMSAPGAGTMLGAVLISALGDFQHKGRALFLAMLVFSLTIVAFTLSRGFVASVALLFVAGFASLLFNTMLSTMMQLEIEDQMRGRVMSLQTVAFQGFSPFGGLLAGAVATEIGTPDAVMISALIVGFTAIAVAMAVPRVREFVPPEAQDDPARQGWAGVRR